MADASLTKSPERKPVEWLEETIPVRDCYLTIGDIFETCRELSKINKDFGRHIISMLKAEEGLSEV
jgi:hypothetical protein